MRSNTCLIRFRLIIMPLYGADLTGSGLRSPKKSHAALRGIAADFVCNYILTDLQHGNFLKQAAQDPGLVEVYGITTW